MFGRKKRKEAESSSLPPYKYERDGTLVHPTYAKSTKIIESYWITPGLSRVSIVRNEAYEYVYYTHEPSLTEFEAELLDRLHSGVRDLLIIKEIVVEDRQQALYEAIDVLIDEYRLTGNVEASSIYKLRYYLERSFFGWGRIDILRGDYDIEDISCDGYGTPVYLYHRKYRDMRTTIKFTEPHELDSLVALFAQKAGKSISLANPIVDATMPEGSRIQLTYGTVVSNHGSTFTIRKFREVPYSPIDLILNGTFTVAEMVYLWMAVQYNHSILIIGGTASGKTTTLNAMSQFIPALSKVVTIEDTREITLSHENWIPSVVPPTAGRGGDTSHDITMFDLLTAAMRQRPEYILVGEVRGVETQTMFQAMNTGHTTFSTFHAGDVVTAINRLQNPPLNIPKATIETLDVVLSQSRMFKEGHAIRRCNEIIEIVGLTDVGDLEINSVFTYHADTDSPTYSGFSDVYSDIGIKTNMSGIAMQDELRRRTLILEAMIRQNVRDYRDFAQIVWAYLSQPEVVLRNIDDLKQVLTAHHVTIEEFKNTRVSRSQIEEEKNAREGGHGIMLQPAPVVPGDDDDESEADANGGVAVPLEFDATVDEGDDGWVPASVPDADEEKADADEPVGGRQVAGSIRRRGRRESEPAESNGQSAASSRPARRRMRSAAETEDVAVVSPELVRYPAGEKLSSSENSSVEDPVVSKKPLFSRRRRGSSTEDVHEVTVSNVDDSFDDNKLFPLFGKKSEAAVANASAIEEPADEKPLFSRRRRGSSAEDVHEVMASDIEDSSDDESATVESADDNPLFRRRRRSSAEDVSEVMASDVADSSDDESATEESADDKPLFSRRRRGSSAEDVSEVTASDVADSSSDVPVVEEPAVDTSSRRKRDPSSADEPEAPVIAVADSSVAASVVEESADDTPSRRAPSSEDAPEVTVSDVDESSADVPVMEEPAVEKKSLFSRRKRPPTVDDEPSAPVSNANNSSSDESVIEEPAVEKKSLFSFRHREPSSDDVPTALVSAAADSSDDAPVIEEPAIEKKSLFSRRKRAPTVDDESASIEPPVEEPVVSKKRLFSRRRDEPSADDPSSPASAEELPPSSADKTSAPADPYERYKPESLRTSEYDSRKDSGQKEEEEIFELSAPVPTIEERYGVPARKKEQDLFEIDADIPDTDTRYGKNNTKEGAPADKKGR